MRIAVLAALAAAAIWWFFPTMFAKVDPGTCEPYGGFAHIALALSADRFWSSVASTMENLAQVHRTDTGLSEANLPEVFRCLKIARQNSGAS